MPSADRFLTVHRDPHSAEILARGGDSESHSILERAGFVPVVRLHETYHRTPIGLDTDIEVRLVALAVAHLKSAGYHVDCDRSFDTEGRTARHLPLGASVAHLAKRLRQATTTGQATDSLTELTAPYDGILAAIEQVLLAAAEFHDGLGAPSDSHTARRLRHLADEHLHVVRTDLTHTRNSLADRPAPHPGRSTCTADVPADERERSAVCACPPPPRTAPVPPPPPVAPGLRR